MVSHFTFDLMLFRFHFTNNEYLFIVLVWPFVEKYLFRSFAHLQTIVFLLLSCKNSLFRYRYIACFSSLLYVILHL